jgi:putative SOS response-associated peptidase YedK
MSVILPERHRAAWLVAGVQDARELLPPLRPYPADALRAHPVGLLVNSPRSGGPGCLEPAP